MSYINKFTNRIKSVPVQARAAFVYTLASFITRGFHLITTPLFTRILTVEQVGVVANYSTWSSFISTVALLGLTSGAINIALKEFKEDRLGYIKSSQTLTTMGVFVVAILTAIVYPIIRDIIGMPVNHLVLMYVVMLFSSAQSFWMSWNRFEYRYKAVGIVTIASTVLSSLVAVIAVILAKGKGVVDLATVRLYASSSITLIFSVSFYIFFLLRKGQLLNKRYALLSIQVGTPMIIHTLAKSLLSASDRVMINFIDGLEALGYYSVIYTISSLALIAWDAINASLIPYIFNKLDNGKSGEVDINNITIMLLVTFAGCSLLLILFAPEIIYFIASEKYSQAVYVLPPVAAGIYFIAVYSLYSNIIMYHKKTKYLMMATMVAATFNVVTNYIFITKFGYIAAAYTTLSSYCLLALIYFLAYRKVVGHAIFDDKKIWTISSIVVIFSLVCCLLYSFTAIRYIIVVCLLVVATILRHKIIKIVRVVRKKD